MDHKVYVITNGANGKLYVGYTSQSLSARFAQHRFEAMTRNKDLPLYRAMRRDGPEVFSIRLDGRFEEQDTALDREAELIEELNAYGSDGYNVTRGGEMGNLVVGEDRHNATVDDEAAYQVIKANLLYEVDTYRLAEQLDVESAAVQRWIRGDARPYLRNQFDREYPDYDGWTKVDDRRLEIVRRIRLEGEVAHKVADRFGMSRGNATLLHKGEIHSHVRERFDKLWPDAQHGQYGNHTGTSGEDNPASKLSDTDREEICRRYEAGETQSSLAEEYGVAQTTISRTVN